MEVPISKRHVNVCLMPVTHSDIAHWSQLLVGHNRVSSVVLHTGVSCSRDTIEMALNAVARLVRLARSTSNQQHCSSGGRAQCPAFPES
jgi:hypothetical protein